MATMQINTINCFVNLKFASHLIWRIVHMFNHHQIVTFMLNFVNFTVWISRDVSPQFRHIFSNYLLGNVLLFWPLLFLFCSSFFCYCSCFRCICTHKKLRMWMFWNRMTADFMFLFLLPFHSTKLSTKPTNLYITPIEMFAFYRLHPLNGVQAMTLCGHTIVRFKIQSSKNLRCFPSQIWMQIFFFAQLHTQTHQTHTNTILRTPTNGLAMILQ